MEIYTVELGQEDMVELMAGKELVFGYEDEAEIRICLNGGIEQ